MPLVLLLIAGVAGIAIASARRRDNDHAQAHVQAHEHAQTQMAEHLVLRAPFVVRFQSPHGQVWELFASHYPGPAANAYEAIRRHLIARGQHGRLSLYANTPSSVAELRVEVL